MHSSSHSHIHGGLQVSSTLEEDVEAPDDITFYVSVDDGPWIEAPMMGHEAKNQDEAFASHPLFISGSSVQYKITGPHIDAVRNVRVTHFDSTTPPNKSTFSALADTFSDPAGELVGPDIVTREEWGAEETYHTWVGEAVAPKMFIIHHTAGGDGGSDPEATIRGIYYWHSVGLGWGDIGYNYIVDPSGTIYEGRARLTVEPTVSDAEVQATITDVVGAHTYNSVDQLNYNEESIGIAVMGCYETTEGACGTTNDYNKDIRESITDLIAAKALEHGIQPKSSTTVFDEKINTIVGHRDVDYTYCPGDSVEGKLKKIRKISKNKYNRLKEIHSAPDIKADIVESSFGEAYTLSANTEEISVTYANIGTKKWKPEDVRMQVAVQETGKRQGVQLLELTEADGQATFTFDWTTMPKKSGTYTVATKMYRKGKVVQGSKEFFTVQVTNPYSAKVLDSFVPAAMQVGWQPVAEITYRNKSAMAIPAGSIIQLNNAEAKVLNKELAPGEKRTFAVQLNPNGKWKAGTKAVVIRMKTADGIPISGSRLGTTVRIDPAS